MQTSPESRFLGDFTELKVVGENRLASWAEKSCGHQNRRGGLKHSCPIRSGRNGIASAEVSPVTQREKARRIFLTTPGVVADEVFVRFGVSKWAAPRCGLPVVRINKFGWVRR